MKHELVGKIERTINSGIDSECKVLYLLAETRKFMDLMGKAYGGKFPNLYFFCNWVLHSEMYRDPSKKLLADFESRINFQSTLKAISIEFIKSEAHFYLLGDLKREIGEFLKSNCIAAAPIVSDRNWRNFTKLLLEILKDCPITSLSARLWKFSYESLPQHHHECFRVHIRGKGSFKITF